MASASLAQVGMKVVGKAAPVVLASGEGAGSTGISSLTESLVTGLSDIGNQLLTALGSIIPAVLLVVGGVAVVTFGIKIFRKFAR